MRWVPSDEMLFGAHVKTGGRLPNAITRGEEAGCEVVQVFTQNSRGWRATNHAPELLAEYRERQAASPTVRSTICHATYLINLAAGDEAIFVRSVETLGNNLRVASGIGADGVVVHVGSHGGRGLDDALPTVAAGIRVALDVSQATCPVLLENTAGAGGTVGRTFDELAAVLDAVDGDERVGVCLDSQHLWASGRSFADAGEMDGVVVDLDAAVGLDRLRCLHLNDSKVPLGSNRDRHENLGAGEIGKDGLAAFLGHPAFDGLPAVLEIAGFNGRGAERGDLELARTLRELGRARRAN